MQNLLCYSVDVESKDGQPIGARFGITSLPGLVFLDPDGARRDQISGYLPTATFLAEVKRIESGVNTLSDLRAKLARDPKSVVARLDLALELRQLHESEDAGRELAIATSSLERGEGFDAQNIDARWKIAERLDALGDEQGFEAQLAAIRTLDPHEDSLVLRRLHLKELFLALNQRFIESKVYDASPIVAFLSAQTDSDLLFRGWDRVQDMEIVQTEEARNREKPDEERTHRAAARTAGREAWKHCPPDLVAEWGKAFAYMLFEDADVLTRDEKDLAVEVARKAAEAAPRNTDNLEMLACCLSVTGKKDEAKATLERALAIDPGKASLKERLKEVETERLR